MRALLLLLVLVMAALVTCTPRPPGVLAMLGDACESRCLVQTKSEEYCSVLCAKVPAMLAEQKDALSRHALLKDELVRLSKASPPPPSLLLFLELSDSSLKPGFRERRNCLVLLLRAHRSFSFLVHLSSIPYFLLQEYAMYDLVNYALTRSRDGSELSMAELGEKYVELLEHAVQVRNTVKEEL